jgi:hypothetical protein
MPLELGG